MEEGMEQRLPTWLVDLILDTLACFPEPQDRGTVYLGTASSRATPRGSTPTPPRP